MVKFLCKSLVIISPILCLLISVNYYIDPAMLSHGIEKQMVDIIQKGKYVTNITNYDERLYQLEFINQLDYTPDIVVIGSSRTMLISNDYYPNKKLVNNSVSGSEIEDFIAIYQIYKENHITPKKIIIGIDPWIFNENTEETRWKSISSFYEKFINKDSFFSTNLLLYKYKELLSLSYFQKSIEKLKKEKDISISKKEPEETDQKYNVTDTKLLDNSLIHRKSYRNVTDEQVKAKIQSYLSKTIYKLGDFNSLSERTSNELNMLIKELKSNGIEIEFFLSPYPPVVYKKITEKYKIATKVEDYIIEYSKQNNIKLIGSFNPEKLKLDRRHFYDGMHCKEDGIKKIIGIK